MVAIVLQGLAGLEEQLQGEQEAVLVGSEHG